MRVSHVLSWRRSPERGWRVACFATIFARSVGRSQWMRKKAFGTMVNGGNCSDVLSNEPSVGSVGPCAQSAVSFREPGRDEAWRGFGRTYTVPNRFGLRALLVATALFAVTLVLLQAVQASLRMVAPAMSFILLIGLAQMVFGKLPRSACALVGAILFPVCAWIDPMFEGRMKTQSIGPIDLFWLFTCGAVAGYVGGVILAGMFLVADQLRQLRGHTVYAVPRRFGTGTLLVATTLFAMLFAFLQWARARPEELFFYSAFVATVSVAQMVFERSPRWASVLAGGFYLPLSMLIIPMVRGRGVWRGTGSIGFIEWTILGLCIGYLGGALVAGIFLASDFLAKSMQRQQPSPPTSA